MRITKLLSEDSAPAQTIVDRAAPIALTLAERITLPASFTVGGEAIENGLGDVRSLEVGDVLVDEKGSFYRIDAAPEAVLRVTGDIDLMQEAAYAFMMRGLRVAQTEDGFSVTATPQFKEMLESVGLTVTEATEPFAPVPMPRRGGCCGGHRGCGCGGHGHGHEHDHGECGCGGHGHEHGHGECGCGGHGHEHGHGECGCGGHGHKH